MLLHGLVIITQKCSLVNCSVINGRGSCRYYSSPLEWLTVTSFCLVHDHCLRTSCFWQYCFQGRAIFFFIRPLWAAWTLCKRKQSAHGTNVAYIALQCVGVSYCLRLEESLLLTYDSEFLLQGFRLIFTRGHVSLALPSKGRNNFRAA